MESKKLLLNTSIELIDNDESFASVSLNPFIQWAKIVITDDQPNANKQKIPLEEFDNLIKTGIHAPIKMEFGSIADHKEAKGKPIGVIANIVKEANKLIALAAFWKKEREDDVAMLKDMYLKNQPPQTSWEVSFSESSVDEEEIESLKGTILNGLAIVTNPAYVGRTPFIAMASEENKESSMTIEEYEAKIKELQNLLTQKEEAEKTVNAELEELRKYKADAEKIKSDEIRMASIRNKFKEANVEKEEKYFEDNREKFLGMDDSLIDFVIQEFVSFSSKNADASNKTKIPNVRNTNDEDNLKDPKVLAQKLRELRLKK